MKAIFKKPVIPETRCSKIILCSFSFYFLSDVIHGYLFRSIDPFIYSRTEQVTEYAVRALRDASLILCLSTMIIGGLLAIRAEGFSLKKILMPTLGILFCIYWTGIAWIGHIKMREVVAQFDRDQVIVQKLDDMFPELIKNPQANANKIYWLAKMHFGLDGKRIEYPDKDGKTAIYEPTEKEQKQFDQIKKSKSMIKQSDKSLERAAYLWGSVLVFSTIFGIAMPVKRSSKSLVNQRI